MSALIGLGARLGNKNEITPMLRYRDGGQWCWPGETPDRHFYSIQGKEGLNHREGEVVLQVAFTGMPEVFNTVSEEKLKEGVKTVTVTVKDRSERMGNAAMRHPVEGKAFTHGIHRLFMDLRDVHGVERIHLLPCASNAACVFLGQAFDANHPEIIVYDFDDNKLVPTLRLKNENQRCIVSNV